MRNIAPLVWFEKISLFINKVKLASFSGYL